MELPFRHLDKYLRKLEATQTLFTKYAKSHRKGKPASNEIWYTANSPVSIITNSTLHTMTEAFGAEYLPSKSVYDPVLKEGTLVFDGNVTKIANFSDSTLSVECFRITNAEEDIQSIILPDTCTELLGDAFYNCPVHKIELPDTLTSIGAWAFLATKINSLNISKNVTSIGKAATAECAELTSIIIDSENENYTSAGCNVIIDLNTNAVIAGCNTTKIPDTVTTINEYSFYGCGIKNLVIPDSVTTIGTSAFRYSTIETIKISNNVATLNNHTFNSCTNLKDIKWGSSLTTIGDYCFIKCQSLSEIILPETITSVGQYAFQACTGATKLYIPGSLTTLNYCTFSKLSGLKDLTISEGVTTIGQYAFWESDGGYVLTLPDSLTSMGDAAFLGTKLLGLHVGNGITTIPAHCFDLSNWSRGYKGEDVDLTSSSLTTIKTYAFYGSNIKHLVIPSNITTIESLVWEGSANMEDVVIGENVVSIGSRSLNGAKLNKITCLATTPPTIAANTFKNSAADIAIMKVYVPYNAVDTYKAAANWKQYNIEAIPDEI